MTKSTRLGSTRHEPGAMYFRLRSEDHRRSASLHGVFPALSGTTDKAMLDSVWTQRSDLSPYGEAMLGLAMNLANDYRVAEGDLSRGAIVDEQSAHWN